MERLVDDEKLHGRRNEGFIKKRLSSGLSGSQLNTKTQGSLRC